MERLTRQRRAVLEALACSGRTLRPNEILEMARQVAPGLNLSTVYRQIRALIADREIVRVDLPGQPARFEAHCDHDHHAESISGTDGLHKANQPHHHHHFHCTGCEAVVPIHGCPGNMQALAPSGYRVETHDLLLHGRCATCLEQPAP